MNELGLCRCGCGNAAKIAPRTYTSRGWVRGKPQPYLRGHAAWKNSGPRWIVNEADCWIWQRTVDPQGYARGNFNRLGYNSPGLLVHRIFYMEKYGPIPAGMTLDHTCHTADENCSGGPACPHRPCVNPDHGEPVTDLENVHRGVLTKASEMDMARVYELRQQGMSWRKIAPLFGMTHAPLVTRMHAYCERNGLAWP